MDDGKGQFRPVTEEAARVAEEHRAPVFHVDATVTINGSVFRVRKITRKDLILRLIPGAKP